ncbi:MAG: YegS/Rv2252/BmrU family lipid kinase [Ginsengibacter sp.]
MDKKMIALLVNPLALQKVKKILAEISQVLTVNAIQYELYHDPWPIEINGFKELWIIGGDGTLNYCLNKYRDISIPIAIFKGGTGNDFANTLYGDLTPLKQAEYLLSASTHQVDAGMCNTELFINGAGIGFDGEVVRSIKSIRWIGGHFGYMLAVLKQVLFYKEKRFKIEYDQQVIDDKFLLCVICNSSSMGGGFKVAPGSRIDDGVLDVVLCRKLGLLKRLRYLPVIEKGRHLNLEFIRHFKAVKLRISCNQEVFIQLDGELRSGKSFDITVMHKRYIFKF